MIDCLNSLLPQTHAQRVEVLAAGIPEIGAFAKGLGATYDSEFRFLETDRQGFVPGYILGAASALGDWLLFFDDDTVVPPGFMSRFLELIETTDLDVLGLAAMPLPDDAYFSQSIRFLELALRRSLDRPIAIWMSQMACRRVHYEALGGFRLEHGLNLFREDGFVTRARSLGLKVAYLPDVCVYDHAQSAAATIKLNWRGVKTIDVRLGPNYYRLPYAMGISFGGIAGALLLRSGKSWRLPLIAGGSVAVLAGAAVAGTMAGAPLRFAPGIMLAATMRAAFLMLRAMLYVAALPAKRSKEAAQRD
jgi:GT2 family glycosyltransferase